MFSSLYLFLGVEGGEGYGRVCILSFSNVTFIYVAFEKREENAKGTCGRSKHDFTPSEEIALQDITRKESGATNDSDHHRASITKVYLSLVQSTVSLQ